MIESGGLNDRAVHAAQALIYGLDEAIGVARFAAHARKVLRLVGAEIAAADDDYGDIARVLPRFQLSIDIASVHARQGEIEDDERRPRVLDLAERIDTVLDSGDDIAGRTQCVPIQLAKLGIVFDDENSSPW